MKQELDLCRPTITPASADPTTASRKALREKTDDLIHNALLIDDLPGLVALSAETMICVATTLLRYDIEPDVRDLVDAAQAHIESGRAVMDRGLMLRNWETVRCGSVMLELTVRGICAALSVPYDKVLAEVLRAQQAGENPAIRRVLTEAGVLKPDQ